MRRKHVALVQNYSATEGSIGEKVWTTKDGQAVKVPCNRYELTAEEVTTYGVELYKTRKLFCDSWPGNIHSIITIDGVEWEQHGPSQTFDNTSVVNEVVIIKLRNKKV